MWCHGYTAAVRHGRRQSDHVLGATQRVPAQQGSRRRDQRRRERGRRGPALRREPPAGVQDQTTMGRRRRFRAPAPFPRRAHDSQQDRRRPGLADRRAAQTTGKGRPGRRSRIHRRQAGARRRQAAGELHDPPHPRERPARCAPNPGNAPRHRTRGSRRPRPTNRGSRTSPTGRSPRFREPWPSPGSTTAPATRCTRVRSPR